VLIGLSEYLTVSTGSKMDGRLSRIIRKTATETKVWESPRAIRSSQIANMCPREEYYKSKAYPEPVVQHDSPMDRGLDFTFTLGTFIHEYLQSVVIGPLGFLKGDWICVQCGWGHENCYYPDSCDKCKNCGTFSYEEYSLFDPVLRLSGHVDGKLCKNRMEYVYCHLEAGFPITEITIPKEMEEKLVHLEIKSANDYSYRSIAKSMEIPKYYRIQACSYQYLTGMDETLFLFFNMNSKDMMNISYVAEPDLWEQATQKIRTVWEAIDTDSVPSPSTRVCLSMKDRRAKACPFAHKCFAK